MGVAGRCSTIRRVPRDLQAVRAELPCLADEVYLNTGGSGPMPSAAARAIAGAASAGAARGRMSLAVWSETDRLLLDTRAAAASVVGAPGDDVALVQNTSSGLDVVVWGIDWSPGDEIVCTDCEHPGLSVPVAVAARRHGLRVRWIPADRAHGDLASAVAGACGPRTRLVALSHVAWTTGAVLDVAGAARAAHDAGALCVVDGAQAVGAIPVDAAALGVDAYAFPAQKWLLGPEGLGALWVSREARERIDLTFTGYEAGTGHSPHGDVTLHGGSRRYETSTAPVMLCAGWIASIRWLEELGWDWVHGRTAEMHAAARAAVEDLPDVTVLTPPGPQAGLLTFSVAGTVPEQAAAALAAAGVIGRWLPEPAALRVSLGFFNDTDDIRALRSAVSALAP